MTVIKFPRNICIPLKYEEPLPRQRVFYLGVLYASQRWLVKRQSAFVELLVIR